LIFLRASEGTPPQHPQQQPSRLRRVITAVSLTSFAVYSISLIAASPAQARPRSKKAFVRAETARLRTEPGKHGKMKGLLDAGRKAKVVERDGSWVKVKLDSGTTGWVRADLLAISKKSTRDRDEESSSSSRRRRKRSSEEDDAPRRVAAKRSTRHRDDEERHVAKAKPAKKKPVVAVAKAKPAAKPVVKVKPVVAKAAPAPKPAVTPAAEKVAAVKPAAPSIAKPKAPAGFRLVAVPGVRKASVVAPAAPAPAAATTAAPSGEVRPAPVEVIRPAATPAPEPPASHSTPESGPDGGGNTASAATEQDMAEAIRVALANDAAQEADAAPKGAVQVASVDRRSTRGDRLIRRAMSYRGTPYRMGATGRGAFDCSGFTKFLYKTEGETIPRTAAEQYQHGTPVAKDALKAGDLVFFKNTYKRGVSHVGVYIGSGKFIHASSHGGVRINNLSESYYVNHWAGGRRPR
jgi:cell wall-associated NlpC family hydrolase